MMVAFHKALAEGAGDKLDALRRAQLRLIRMERDGFRPYAAPMYWAAFQLLGDFR